VRLAEVAYFHVVSEQPETGYVIVPRRFPAGARTAVARPSAQSSAPKPGPTLVLELERASRSFRTATLQVAMAVAATASDARSVARALD
jgi:hypothetical protein